MTGTPLCMVNTAAPSMATRGIKLAIRKIARWKNPVYDRICKTCYKQLGVQYLVITSVSSALPLWTKRYGCTPLDEAESAGVNDRIVLPELEAASLLKMPLNRHALTVHS